MMKLQTTLFALALCSTTLTAWAAPPEKTFPINTPASAAPKTSTLRVSLMDQGINNISRSLMLRGEYRQLLNTVDLPEQGFVLDLSGQHFFNTHPAVLNDLVAAENYPNFTELNAGLGYRFQLFDKLGVIPQFHFRHMVAASPNVNQHLTSAEPGLRLEYWLYPEVTKISVDYGMSIPFLHLANRESNISPFTLSLNRINVEMSYRLLDFMDVTAGFFWWQVPTQFGTGALTSRDLSQVSGFSIGVGKVF